MHRHRRILIVALAVAALAVIAWWSWPRATPAIATSPAPTASRPELVASTTPALPNVSTAAPTHDERIQAVPALPPPQPYPPNSQPLTEGSDPATTVPEDDPVDAERGIHAVFGPRRDVVHPPDPIVIDLQVLDAKGKRLAIGNGEALFRGERDSAATGTGARVGFVDDGRLAYTATFTPSSGEQQTLAQFRTFVEVAFDAPNGGGRRRYSTWVQYTPRPHAELDGAYRDAIENGSLVVYAGVAASAAGRFKVIASLYAADGTTAIAFAQNAAELAPGRGEIPLTFFGKIIHDSALDGPYVVRYAMLFEEFPDRGVYWPGVTVDHAYTTRAYRATDFSDAPYVAPAANANEPQVTAASPSQQGKPPPLFTR